MHRHPTTLRPPHGKTHTHGHPTPCASTNSPIPPPPHPPQVGSSKWQTQTDYIQQLNIQAHLNASTHSEEFVVDLLVSLDKAQTLVHNLLVIESWRSLVFPI